MGIPKTLLARLEGAKVDAIDNAVAIEVGARRYARANSSEPEARRRFGARRDRGRSRTIGRAAPVGALEANGWEVMLHFVALGLGAAIVNACCRMPPGVVARTLPELPPVRYVVVTRSRSADARVARLALDLRSHAEAWRSAQQGAAVHPGTRRRVSVARDK